MIRCDNASVAHTFDALAWYVVRVALLVCLLVAPTVGAGAQGAATVSPAALDVADRGQVGENDFRISEMGGDINYAARSPVITYNGQEDEYFIAWWGDNVGGLLVDDEVEIWGQRIDVSTGLEIGPARRLSDMGPDGDPAYGASDPAIAYNSTQNQYLVVWLGDDNTGGLVEGEVEIFGQRVDAADGNEIGEDFRVSILGPDGDPEYDAGYTDVAYNPQDDQYLVVWSGSDDTDALVKEEYEIFGQRIDGASGAKLGEDFRISEMGPDGDTAYFGGDPSVAYNSQDGQYLVVWGGYDDRPGFARDETEIYGQRLEGASGAKLGDNFRISEMGPDGDPAYEAYSPAVVYNEQENHYLVVWEGDDNAGDVVEGEFEIYGQRLAGATGADVGGDFRISEMGPQGEPTYGGFEPAVVHSRQANQYLVLWRGDDNSGDLAQHEFEVYGQRLDAATGDQLGEDFRISQMGPDGDIGYNAFDPDVAYNENANEFLVGWHGDDDTGSLVENEIEIHVQFLDGSSGEELGRSFRLSYTGGDTVYDAFAPAMAYSSVQNEYLVVWWGNDDATNLAPGEFEIWGQRIDAATGDQIGQRLRISQMGPDGDGGYDAFSPAIAYDDVRDQYLVVWRGNNDSGNLDQDEFEVWGQRIEAATGAEIGDDFRISEMGPDGDADYDLSFRLDVAYNGDHAQFLVVWAGSDDRAGLAQGEYEVYGQRLDATTGDQVGGDFRISDMGPDGSLAYQAFNPALVYAPKEAQYLVMWTGDDDSGALVDEEFEIWGQRLDGASGAEIGDDFRISAVGPDGDPDYEAYAATAAYDPVGRQYLVAWAGDNDRPGLVDDEYEVWGQRLDAVNGAHVGDVLRISAMGPDGDADYGADSRPDVVYNERKRQYLVVWAADDDTGNLVEDEMEVYGQHVEAASGARIGGRFRLSDMGFDGAVDADAQNPVAAYSPQEGQYLIVWRGDDVSPGVVDQEFEIYGQRYMPLQFGTQLPRIRGENG